MSEELNIIENSAKGTAEKVSEAENNLELQNVDAPNAHWFAVTTQTGKEQKAKDNLLARIETYQKQDKIFNIIVAEQEVPVLDKQGIPTKKTKMLNVYRGYIFVQMIMEDDVWYIVRNTPEIQGIVGSHGNRSKPTPLTKEEIDVVFKKVGIKNTRMAIANLEGKRIKLLAGGFRGLEATIVAVDIDNQSFSVELIYMGRKKVVVVNSDEAEILM